MVIGTIVKSNSHVSYLCRVYGKLETDNLPEPSEYAFGAFLTVLPHEPAEGSRLVGIVRDTILVNPEYGNHGPRLSPDRELAVFSPDYLNEKGVLVDLLVLGWTENGGSHHSIPPLSAQVGARVEVMPEADVVDFHRDLHGKFSMQYLPRLMSRNDPNNSGLLIETLDRLVPSFPDQRRVIDVLRNNLAWKAQVVPAG